MPFLREWTEDDADDHWTEHGDRTPARVWSDEDERKAENEREVRCVNAHDRCFGGAGGPCPYCEPRS
jgi:hypothetical protein